MKEVFLFPIHFNSNIRKETLIDKNLKLRRITKKEISNFFGIKINERFENGLIKSLSGGRSGPLSVGPFSSLAFDVENFLLSSQFVLESKEIKYVEYFQQALKLHKDGKTGVLYGKNPKVNSSHFLKPNPFYGKRVYLLKIKDILKIKKLYNKIKKTNNKKYDLIIEKFLFALSGENIKDEHRFLELVSILEMLYLESSSHQELSFRISLRVAKVLSKYLSMNSRTIFKDMRKIYNIRSGISHSGHHKETGKYLDKLIDYTRKSIKLFLKDSSIFKDLELDKLCVE